MKNKILIWGFVIILILLAMPAITLAGRVLPRFANPVKSTASRGVVGIYLKPSLRSDHRALNIYISGLSRVRTVSYMLIYKSAGVDKGAGGSIDPSNGDAVNRELLFGTESSGVYHYDEVITDMKLEVTTEFHTGKKTLKKFKIRI